MSNTVIEDLERQPTRFVVGYAEQLRAMQAEWCAMSGCEEVPLVVLLSGPGSPHGVKLFAWPSPWLH